MALPLPTSLSPSKVSSFTDCALAFRFSAIDHLPEPPSVAATRGHARPRRAGAALHPPRGARTNEMAHRCLAEAREAFRADPEFIDLGLDEDAEATFAKEAGALVDKYFRLEDPTTITPIGIELKLEVDLGGVRLRGIIDRLELDADGELVVTDYKTGARPGRAPGAAAAGRRGVLLAAVRAALRSPAGAGAAAVPRRPGRDHLHPHRPVHAWRRAQALRRVDRGRAGVRAGGLPARTRRGCATGAASRPTAPPSAATSRSPTPTACSSSSSPPPPDDACRSSAGLRPLRRRGGAAPRPRPGPPRRRPDLLRRLGAGRLVADLVPGRARCRRCSPGASRCRSCGWRSSSARSRPWSTGPSSSCSAGAVPCGRRGPRPHRLRTPRTSSFPSGHASAAFSAAGVLTAGATRSGPLYYAIADRGGVQPVLRAHPPRVRRGRRRARGRRARPRGQPGLAPHA